VKSVSSSDQDEKHIDNPPSEDEGEVAEEEAPPSDSATTPDTKDKEPTTTPAAKPPLPVDEEPPPLPNEAPPDDGWEPVWDDRAGAFYFYNRITNATQWENPRVPQASQPTAPPGVESYDGAGNISQPPPTRKAGGYDPAIHGDYDPTADYAKVYEAPSAVDGGAGAPGTSSADMYAATGTFNRFTGKWQRADLNPENFTDEQKSRRQMNAFFDVDAAANSHNGKSLRAERQNQKLSKAELKAFKEKRREKKEEKRRAWLRD
jgi:hypothetical protein